MMCSVLVQLKKDSRSSDESVSANESSSGKEPKVEELLDKNGIHTLEQNGLSAHRMPRK